MTTRPCSACVTTFLLAMVTVVVTEPAAAVAEPDASAVVDSASTSTTPPTTLRVGDAAPAFVLKTLNEAACGLSLVATKRTFGPQAGQPRALVLSFGASYCKPCRAELPHFKAVAERHAGGSALFVLIIRDEEQAGIDAMLALAESVGVRFPVLGDRYSLVARRYGAEELPYLVVIGADGRIRWQQSGFHDDTMARLDDVLVGLVP